MRIPCSLQFADSGRSCFLDRISDAADMPGIFAIDGDCQIRSCPPVLYAAPQYSGRRKRPLAPSARVANRYFSAFNDALYTFASLILENPKARESFRFTLLALGVTMAAASGCSLTRSRLAARRSISFAASMPRGGIADRGNRNHVWDSIGQRSGFVEDDGIDFLQRFKRLGILDQDSCMSAASGADHDRHRRRQTQRAGASNDQHSYGVYDGVREARLWSEADPRDEG